MKNTTQRIFAYIALNASIHPDKSMNEKDLEEGLTLGCRDAASSLQDQYLVQLGIDIDVRKVRYEIYEGLSANLGFKIAITTIRAYLAESYHDKITKNKEENK